MRLPSFNLTKLDICCWVSCQHAALPNTERLSQAALEGQGYGRARTLSAKHDREAAACSRRGRDSCRDVATGRRVAGEGPRDRVPYQACAVAAAVPRRQHQRGVLQREAVAAAHRPRVGIREQCWLIPQVRPWEVDAGSTSLPLK